MFGKVFGNGIVTYSSIRSSNFLRSFKRSSNVGHFGNNAKNQSISNESIRKITTIKTISNQILHLNSPTSLEKNNGELGKFKSLISLTIGKRTFATNADQPNDVDPNVFHRVADETLERFQEKIEIILANMNEIESDVTYQDGVLTIKLGQKGTYVINKQSPNRQIWFSSPISGPKRYNLDVARGVWVNTRDSHMLHTLLSNELTKLLQHNVSV